MNKNLDIIKSVVLDMGGKIEEFIVERDCFYVNLKGKHILLEKDISITRESFISAKLTKYKDVTNKLLSLNSLFSPKSVCFYKKNFTKNKALKKLNSLKYPVILKNASGSNSRGIFSNIENSEEAFKILKREINHFRCMIAQEMVYGKEYRVLVLGEKIIAALEMIHPYVTGDGVKNIRKLITEKQIKTSKKTKFNKELKNILKDQKVSLNFVLAKDKIIYIKNNSCLAEGGMTKDVTDIVNKEVKDVCISASKIVGRYLVGIDIICKDISKKPNKNNFFILELNGKPDLHIHHKPTFGKPRNVLKDVIKHLIKIAN